MDKAPASRVDRLLSSMGYGSRSKMARMARRGSITLHAAEIADATKRIRITSDLSTRMETHDQALDLVAGMVILLNKPSVMTFAHKEDGPRIFDILPERWRRVVPVVSAISRLDKQTSCLLLLTADGDLLHHVISPKRHVKKTYWATLARPLDGNEGALFAAGLLMLEGEDRPLAPAELEVVSETEALLSITEGRYHQVRRMFTATRNHVVGMQQECVGGLIVPPGMAAGAWKLLGNEEIASIFQQAVDCRS